MPQTFVLPKQVGIIGGEVAPASVMRFYQTGTSTPQNVYTDAALSNAVTSVTADSAGVFAKVYLNPSASANYRVTLENSAGTVTWTEDDISKNPLTQASVGETLFPRTAAEIAAGVTPTNYAYDPYTTPRYGALGDATTDDAAAIQREIDSCQQAGAVLDLWGTTATGYKINTALEITSKIKILGHGHGKCGIIANGVNAFNLAAGLNQVQLEGFRINSATRHTVTPNTLKAINIQGTTASACNWHNYRDLFIDGFETPIQAAGLRASEFHNITTVFGKHGIISDQQTVNNRVISCLLTGTGSGSYGVKAGDGSAASEGWIISNSIIYGFSRGVWGYGCNNSQVIDNIIDFFSEYGVLLQSGAAIAATNWIIKANYMAASGTASTGVRCLSSFASSNNRGNTISENGILVYSGSTLSYGVLIDGTEEYYNRIVDNSLKATTYDCRITSGTSHLIDGNSFLGGGFSATTRNRFGANFGTILTDPNVFMKRDPYTVVRKIITYAASMTPDLNEGNHFDITATNSTNFTLALPTNYVNNEHFTITIRNTSGGALGTATWTTGYKLGTWTQPATGFARSITFSYNPATTYFEEVSRTTADVPN